MGKHEGQNDGRKIGRYNLPPIRYSIVKSQTDKREKTPEGDQQQVSRVQRGDDLTDIVECALDRHLESVDMLRDGIYFFWIPAYNTTSQ